MKRITRIAIIVLMLLIGSAFLTGCQALMGQAQAPTPAPVVQQAQAVVVEGHIVPKATTGLFFMAPGTVSQVLVKAGQAVKKGDVLAQIGDRESVDAAASAAQLELASAQRQLDDLNKNAALQTSQTQAAFYSAQSDLIQAQQNLADVDTKDHQTKLDNATQTMNKAKDDLKTAQDDFDKVSTLDKDNATRKTAQDKLTTAQNTYDQAVRDHDLLANEVSLAKALETLAEAKLNDATVARDAHKDGPDPADLTLANARLANDKAQLVAAQSGLSHLTLTAPYDGAVTRVDVVVGDPVLPNQPVIVIADLSQLYVETSDLTEKDVVSVRTGQKITAVPDALPDLSLTGSVESIADGFVEKSGDITYVVRIPLDSSDPRLRWGMTVKVTFSQKN